MNKIEHVKFAEYERVTKTKDKYFKWYTQYKNLWKREKQDRATFAKRVTELENKKVPTGFYEKLMYLIRK